MNCKPHRRCRPVFPTMMLRAERRAQFIRRHYDEIKHALSHGFSFHAPILSCQHEIIEKARRQIPYAGGTGSRDILWRLDRDFQAICKESPQ